MVNLKCLSLNCQFGHFLNDVPRDQLVVGLSDTLMTKKLIMESVPTFEKAKQIVSDMKMVKSEFKIFTEINSDIFKVHYGSNKLSQVPRASLSDSVSFQPAMSRGVNKNGFRWVGSLESTNHQCKQVLKKKLVLVTKFMEKVMYHLGFCV